MKIGNSPFLNFFVWLKPRGLNSLLEQMIPGQIKKYFSFVESNMIERSQIEARSGSENSHQHEKRKDIFHYLYHAQDPETGLRAFSPKELAYEASLLIIAGSDTIAGTLSAFMFYITRYPLVYQKLAKEVKTSFRSADDIQSGTALSSCRYMRACIDETLRMSSPGVAELVREVMPGGLEVDGNYIPEGFVVGTSTWAFHHNEDAFPDPWVFRPERWIVDEFIGVTKNDLMRAEASFSPFSAGVGNCVGKNLAYLELMITVAKLFHQMDIRLPPGDHSSEGDPSQGWGRRHKYQYQVRDKFVALRDGPMAQFQRRTD